MTELKDVARGISMRATRIDEPARFDPNWRCFGWQCSLSLYERRYVTKYWMGIGHVDKAGFPKRPTMLEVLDCLLTDAGMAEEGFEDWCASLGYNTDSRHDLRTYNECLEIRTRLEAFLGEQLFKACLAADRL